MKKLIFLFYLIIPNLVLASNLCQSSFDKVDRDKILQKLARDIDSIKRTNPENLEGITSADIYVLRIERIAEQYSWLSTSRAFAFQRIAEQEMGFTKEEVIQMLKHRRFMFYVINSRRLVHDEFRKNWTEEAINAAPGLVIMKFSVDAKLPIAEANKHILNNIDGYASEMARLYRTHLTIAGLGIATGLIVASILAETFF